MSTLLLPTCGHGAQGKRDLYLPKCEEPPLTCNMSSQSSRPTKMSSRGSRWRVPLLLTKNQDVTLILAPRRPAWPCGERVNTGALQPGLWSPGADPHVHVNHEKQFPSGTQHGPWRAAGHPPSPEGLLLAAGHSANPQAQVWLHPYRAQYNMKIQALFKHRR